ncbi:MAG: mercuric reductase [Ardenticatenaceae bacterium]|nr:mercuric reductase [Ardenticatenaceae bacterium]
MSDYQILPAEDDLNQILISNARPSDWKNPTPSGRYNLVVIGGGSAGLVAAAGASAIGAKVALIEKNYLGGDCLNVGCMPSKAVIRAGRAAYDVEHASEFGIDVHGEVEVDFHRVMRHMRHTRAEISPHDSAYRYTDLGVDVYFGEAKFTSPNSIEVDGKTLTFSKALISTGSHPAHIPIPGLADTGYLTNETVFNLTEQPKSMAVIGAGPIGAELAQTFQRLGTQVTLLDIAPHALPREDEDAAEIVQESLIKDGIKLLLGVKTQEISRVGGQKRIIYEKDGEILEVEVEEILLAVGRRPNISGLGLEDIGINFDKFGIKVNDQLQTSVANIYAAGDVAHKYQFTHVAGHAAAIVVQNALFPFPKRKFSNLTIPWVTYTDPEVAHVGIYPSEAAEQGIEIDTYTQPMAKIDRAISEGDTEGFVKIHTVKGKGKILGATIVARHAGEMINEITMAMKHDISLGALSTLINPYPTQSEAIGKAAGLYNRTRLTPMVEKILGWWMKRTR